MGSFIEGDFDPFVKDVSEKVNDNIVNSQEHDYEVISTRMSRNFRCKSSLFKSFDLEIIPWQKFESLLRNNSIQTF